jgi:hypothetical protein
MANANFQDKNRIKHVAGLTLSVQTANPLVAGDVGLYADSNGVQSVDSAGAATNVTNAVKQKTTVLTNAQVLALRATPITLVAAPGTGKILELVSALLVFDRTAAYTETTDNLAIKYTDGAGQAVSETIETTGFVDAAADAVMPVKPITSAVILASAGVNKALVLHNTGDGEFGGGNAANTVTAIVNYRVIATGL